MKPRLCWVAVVALAAWVPVSAAEYSLGGPERLLLQRATMTNVAIGDVNGDGRNDLAATMRVVGITNLYVYIQRTDGTLAPPLVFELPFAYGTDQGFPLSVIDVEGDGIDELAFGSMNPGMGIVRYDGTGMLSIRHHEAWGGCQYQAVGDIDQDGNSDIACHDWKFTATVYYGDGQGGFESRAWRTSFGAWDPYYHFKGMRLADATGDGRLDLIGTDSTINSFFVYESADDRSFLPGRAYPHPSSNFDTWSPSLATMDLGGDGKIEVLTASPENGSQAMFNVHRRHGDGFLRRTERVPSYDSVTALQAADVDGDGLQELVAAHYGFNAVTITYQVDGKLARTDRYELWGFVGHNHSIALGDLDSDGCLDLAAGSYSGLFVHRGCREPRYTLPRNDLDGDGVSDIIVAINPTVATAEIWRWADDLAFWQDFNNQQVPYIPGNIQVQAMADFDGDGGSDLFIRNLETGENLLLRNAYHRRALAPLQDQAWQVAGAGDFDGDDRADLFWRNTVTGDNVVWSAASAQAHQFPGDVDDVRWQVAGVGDFDGNGVSDVFWRHEGGATAIWYDGKASHAKTSRSISAQWQVVGIGDFDGDHADDVVWRNTGNGANAIWLGADPGSQPVVRSRPTDWIVALVGDFNGDDRDDLLWRNEATGDNEIWRSGDATRIQSVAWIPTHRRIIR